MSAGPHPLAAPLARWLAGQAVAPVPDLVALADALVEARAAGATCIPLAGRGEALARAGLLGEGAPLVAVGERLALRATWSDEQGIADRLLHLAGQPPTPVAAPQEALLAAWSAPEGSDRQGEAMRCVCQRRLTLLTGGPGRGKTHTLVRAVAAVLAGRPGARIALAAPTGKAARRLREAVLGALAAPTFAGVLPPGLVPALQEAAEGACTLHRLLGYRPDDDRFRHGRGEPLAADLVVVDEAGMLDLALARSLVEALGAGCGLVLAGDSDQLPSVAAGAVFADLVAAGRAGGPLAPCTVVLERDWRSDPASAGLRALAEAVRQGDAAAAWRALEGGASAARAESHDHAAALDALAGPYRAVLQAADPAAALQAFGEARLLCALREGPCGVAAWNRRVRERLGLREGDPAGPALVTVNDGELGLANGDIGVRLPRRATTAFLADDGAMREVLAARVPGGEAAWAMTVHKAQGSEYGQVVLALPPGAHPLLTRPLLYTGITRARRGVLLLGSRAALDAAIANQGRRDTLLRGLL